MARILGVAAFSPDRKYRYLLTREWEPLIPGKKSVLFVMLNPSTADSVEDDPTIRRCIGFAKRLECRELVVVNLYAYRATDWKELLKVEDPIGEKNDEQIRMSAQDASVVVAAWGAHVAHIPGGPKRVDAVIDIISASHVMVKCLGFCKNKEPRHPLMIRANAPFENLWELEHIFTDVVHT